MGGVYDKKGNLCQESIQKKNSYRNIDNQYDNNINYEIIKESVIFGGMLQNEHFGHFITESISRLWALWILRGEYKNVIFYRRVPGIPERKFVQDFFQVISPESKIYIAERPVCVELLAIPEQIIHPLHCMIFGHEAHDGLRNALIKKSRQKNAKKIYVSRSKLSRRDGGILFESRIDELMSAEGYEVIYPEKLSISDQIGYYASAEILVFSEGSAIHLYALVASASQRVFVIWRRTRLEVFHSQIISFGGRGVEGSAAIEQLWVPEREFPARVHGQALISFSNVGNQLERGGFIESASWPDLSEDEVLSEIRLIESETKQKYIKM